MHCNPHTSRAAKEWLCSRDLTYLRKWKAIRTVKAKLLGISTLQTQWRWLWISERANPTCPRHPAVDTVLRQWRPHPKPQVEAGHQLRYQEGTVEEVLPAAAEVHQVQPARVNERLHHCHGVPPQLLFISSHSSIQIYVTYVLRFFHTCTVHFSDFFSYDCEFTEANSSYVKTYLIWIWW